MKTKLSVVIIARDEEEMIKDCLKSVSWANEVILIDTGSRDKTPLVARGLGARVVRLKFKESDFANWRNRGLKEAKGEWIFYLDADERMTPLLRKEILRVSTDTPGVKYSAYAVPRRNFYFNKEMRYGNTRPDYVKRLFYKKILKGWQGEVHEEPIIKGTFGKLKEPLIHFTHRDLTSMMEKTIKWTKIEAGLLYKADHPKVVWWRILRMMLTKFWQRIVKQQAWRDGTEGWINSIFEVFNTFIIYARLWEKQNQK